MTLSEAKEAIREDLPDKYNDPKVQWRWVVRDDPLTIPQLSQDKETKDGKVRFNEVHIDPGRHWAHRVEYDYAILLGTRDPYLLDMLIAINSETVQEAA